MLAMKIKAFFTKKRIIWTVIILLVIVPIAYKIFKGKNPGANILTDTVKKTDLKLTVLSTGQVTSQTDLSLSFKISGVVDKVSVKVGDKVKEGQVLANLSAQDQAAKYTQARGALAQAEANYQKVLDGASSEDIALSQAAVDAAKVTLTNAQASLTNIKQQQDVMVKNALSALLNSTVSAMPTANNVGSPTVTITGTYAASDQGTYKISIYNSGNGLRFQVAGLENSEGDVKNSPVPLGKGGLFIQFSGNVYTSDSWTVAIPNTFASNYVTNRNAYQAALETQSSSVSAAESAVNSAESDLNKAVAALSLKKAEARPAEVQAAAAQVLSAQGQLQAAEADLENTIIRAPAGGTITKADVKPGELATALKEVFVLQDVGNLHIESNVSEASIAEIKPGQLVEVTFDALGMDRKFAAKVQQVDPASTVISGVVNYKVTVGLENLPEIKPGMTANLNILTAERSSVLAIASRAVLKKDGKNIVRVVTDPKTKAYKEVEVKTGLEADGGLVEISSGLSEGQEVVTFIKQ